MYWSPSVDQVGPPAPSWQSQASVCSVMVSAPGGVFTKTLSTAMICVDCVVFNNQIVSGITTSVPPCNYPVLRRGWANGVWVLFSIVIRVLMLCGLVHRPWIFFSTHCECVSLLGKVAPEPQILLVCCCGLLFLECTVPSHCHVISYEHPIHMIESKTN